MKASFEMASRSGTGRPFEDPGEKASLGAVERMNSEGRR
jgi:hypothetical protein